MVRVRTIFKYRDIQRNNRIYPIGNEFSCSQERAEELIKKGYVELVGEVYTTKVILTTTEGNIVDERDIEISIPTNKEVETAKLTKPKPKPKPKRNVKK